MIISTRTRRLALTVAAGMTVAGLVGGVSYAAGSSAADVSACVSSKGRLALQSSAGKCGKGLKSVRIAKQGPAGANGAKGAKGAQGPGAVVYSQSFLFGGGAGKSVTVDGFVYSTSCTATGSGSSRAATATISVSAPSGSKIGLDGVVNDRLGAGEVTTGAITASTDTTVSHFIEGDSNTVHTEYLPAVHVIGDNGKIQILSLRMTANPNVFNGISVPCSFEGVITPAS